MQLPEDFIQQMRDTLPEGEFEPFMKAMDEPCPVSVRWRNADVIAAAKRCDGTPWAEMAAADEPVVPWCPLGRYLRLRPSFTMDPLLHAGAYYVQEASSMFIWHLCQWLKAEGEWGGAVSALDLCAAPGGKSTLLQTALPAGSRLIANEIMPKRAQVLRENVSKWTRRPVDADVDASAVSVLVTNNSPADVSRMGSGVFDFILCDVPCSGEGMFRKDEKAVEDWSLANVTMCQERQRDIVSIIWKTLREGGYMIYSTCTYNRQEDEDNVRWIADELGADIVSVPVPAEWNVTDAPFYHFYPHRVSGEGFFCALLKKHGATADDVEQVGAADGSEQDCAVDEWRQNGKSNGKEMVSANDKKSRKGHKVKNKKGGVAPDSADAMPGGLKVLPLENKYEPPFVDVGSHIALKYLHGEAIQLPADAPRGLVTVTFCGMPLGLAKNIGARANNLYLKEWRIRKQV